MRALSRRPANPLVTGAVLAVAVVTLYVGAGICVPLVLSVLLAFALAPLAARLRHLGLPNIVSVIVSVAVAALVIAAIAYVLAMQLVSLADKLPAYQTTVAAKLKQAEATFGGGQFADRLTSAVNLLKAQLAPPASGLSPASDHPVAVTIANSPDNPLGMVQSVLGSVLGPLATAAIVIVFLVFLLLERADLRDRFLKLVSRGDLRTSTLVMDEAAARVGRYLLVQFGVNLSYGIIFGLGLNFIGVPNGLLWGMLAALFRYIPFVGTLIIATVPFLLAFAVDPGWSMLGKAVAFYAALELTTTNAIEPRLYGTSTGLSPLAVLVAAMFWATLWGPIGLILSTPLTVCLVVVGRYVPQLQFLEILLGSEPVLRPEEQLYQRLVAGNVEEALELAEFHSRDGDPLPFYRTVAIPTLGLAAEDLAAGADEAGQRQRIATTFAEMIEEIDHGAELPESAGEPGGVAVIGARTEIDAAAAAMVASALRHNGRPATAAGAPSVRLSGGGELDLGTADTACLVFTGQNMQSYARFQVRRLRRNPASLRIVVCRLAAPSATPPADTASLGADAAAEGLDDLLTLLAAAQGRAPAGGIGSLLPKGPEEEPRS